MIVKGFTNCKIYSKFKPIETYEGFLVINDRVAYLGKEKEVESIINNLGGELIDLKGSTVMPGFVDSHLHLLSLGESLRSLDLRRCTSIEEVKRLLKDYSLRSNEYWLLGHGWDHELFKEKRLINRYDVDEIINDRPVLLTRICLHLATLNSKALELLRINERFPTSPNVLRDGNGLPTGVIREDVLGRVIMELRDDINLVVNEVTTGIKHLLANGVTSIGSVNCSLSEFQALQLIRLEDRLHVRIGLYLSSEYIELIEKLRIIRGLGDDKLRILGVKVFIDGSLGARTALLNEPYDDDPNNFGVQVTSEETLNKILHTASKYKLQVASHAIGDRAIDLVLKSYALLDNVKESRHRIEHMSIVRDEQINLAKSLGVTAVVQPRFLLSDWWVIERVGLKRVKYIYPFKKICNSLPTGFSSDAPVEPPNPWEAIYAAITRGEYDGIPLSYIKDNESVDILNALHAHTLGSAYVLFLEDLTGTLEVGKKADFIVVDKDPLEIDAKEIKKIKVLATYVDGRKVYPE
ncbi:MAG: amidohydrolase [Sulfolobales archaeon]